jgi:hypothetical protein
MLFSTLSFAGIFPPQEGDLVSHVSFGFVLDGKTLPAGNYIIRTDQSSGRIEICEDGVYCETAQAILVTRSNEAEARVVFRRDGIRYHLLAVVAADGTRYELASEPEPLILPSGDGSEDRKEVEARLLRINQNAGLGLAMTWH